MHFHAFQELKCHTIFTVLSCPLIFDDRTIHWEKLTVSDRGSKQLVRLKKAPHIVDVNVDTLVDLAKISRTSASSVASEINLQHLADTEMNPPKYRLTKKTCVLLSPTMFFLTTKNMRPTYSNLRYEFILRSPSGHLYPVPCSYACEFINSMNKPRSL